MNSIQNSIIFNIFFLNNLAVSTLLKGFGIKDLISAALLKRKRDKDVWLSECVKLADGICSGS